ncbi:MAG TPA: Na+/H+ antiporter [Casimicrobiaceae bacterium]|nr:Na+/H+ antiporter [Casimicrobiaceae bacterium]
MAIIEITLALLLAVSAVGVIGKWIPVVPLPVLQVGAGIGLSYIPQLASLHVPPETFFLLFIPPLLFADGWSIPKRDLIRVLRPVLMLAFGLVLATVVAVGYIAHWLVPALPLAAAFALGAVISPTDAVAVTEIMRRLSVPTRVTTIVGGESLINDASGLIAFKFAVAAVVTSVFSWKNAAIDFVVLSGGGFILGAALAWLIAKLRVGLMRFCAGDPTIQTIISLLTPYAAYLAAEALGLGSILAIVGAGLYAGMDDPRSTDAATRRHAWEVWEMLLYVFNGVVFLLLGLQLHYIIGAVSHADAFGITVLALLVTATVILVRLVWVFPAAYLPLLLSRRIREREGIHEPRNVFLVGWAGIRGAVTLAAALSIPLTTVSGEPFPGRALIILLAATVILITLLAQGLTLPLFIRWLGIRGEGMREREERAARLATAQAAAVAIRKEMPQLKDPAERAYAQSLIEEYEEHMARYSSNAERRVRIDGLRQSQRRLRLAALRAERDELIELRDTDVINDEVLLLIQADLDHVELLLQSEDTGRTS